MVEKVQLQQMYHSNFLKIQNVLKEEKINEKNTLGTPDTLQNYQVNCLENPDLNFILNVR